MEYYMNKDRLQEILKKYNFKSIQDYGAIISEADYVLYKIFSWPLHDLSYFTELYEKEL